METSHQITKEKKKKLPHSSGHKQSTANTQVNIVTITKKHGLFTFLLTLLIRHIFKLVLQDVLKNFCIKSMRSKYNLLDHKQAFKST